MDGPKKAFIGVLMLTVLVTAGIVAMAPSPQRQIGQSGNLRSFDSYGQMRDYVSQQSNGYQGGIATYVTELRTAFADLAAVPAAALSYTTTNIQVEGVDEPDSVKTDGTYLYVAKGGLVSVIRAYPPNGTEVMNRLKFDGQVIGLFLAPERLVVLRSGQNLVDEGTWSSPLVEILIYDISSPVEPVLVRSLSVNGSYVDSRLTGGYVYAVVQQPTFEYATSGESTFAPPSVRDGEESVMLNPSSVFYSPDSASSFGQYTIILSMSIADGSHSEKAVMTGWGSTIYASTSNIYITFPDFMTYPLMGATLSRVPASGVAAPIFWRGFGGNTTIFRVALMGAGETEVQAEGMIPGTVLNQFSIDEFNGYLRVATTSYRLLPDYSSVQINNVYVLGSGLKVIGAVEGLAPNERIYSVRFLGDVGYVVTFEQVDPLFAISFTDPTNPIVLSALELTGFSDYLHPMGNGLLIGIGKETVPAPQEQGFVLYQGVKVSLFHVLSNGSSSEVAKMVIGDRGSDTPASWDHHAFLYDPISGVMALPIMVATTGQNAGGDVWTYGTPTYQGAFLFSVSSGGFESLGSLTHVPNGSQVDLSGEYFISRVLLIDGLVYTISDRMVMVNTLSDLSLVAQVEL